MKIKLFILLFSSFISFLLLLGKFAAICCRWRKRALIVWISKSDDRQLYSEVIELMPLQVITSLIRLIYSEQQLLQTVNCFRHRVEVLIVLSFASNPARDLRACSTAVKSLQRVKLIYYKNSRKPFIESRNKYKVQQNFCDRVTSRLSALPALLARLYCELCGVERPQIRTANTLFTIHSVTWAKTENCSIDPATSVTAAVPSIYSILKCRIRFNFVLFARKWVNDDDGPHTVAMDGIKPRVLRFSIPATLFFFHMKKSNSINQS